MFIKKSRLREVSQPRKFSTMGSGELVGNAEGQCGPAGYASRVAHIIQYGDQQQGSQHSLQCLQDSSPRL
ncbi:hypothetical protein A6R68_11003 [Neotoma lepida]|uniref:Uncharacterized protein n=1 Tax=Neotoma lepida TaxID=56216 RepID=A0A1A6FWF2_NEOLE|nr:hypothetical protein A6R68_11003 [Neotoma lepida]